MGLGWYFFEMWNLVKLCVRGDFPYEDYMFGGIKGFTVAALLVSYVLLVVILLLNLLIAMMGNTYSKIEESAERRWYRARANLMLVFEEERSLEQMQWVRCRYATKMDDAPAITVDTEFGLSTVTSDTAEWRQTPAPTPA